MLGILISQLKNEKVSTKKQKQKQQKLRKSETQQKNKKKTKTKKIPFYLPFLICARKRKRK